MRSSDGDTFPAEGGIRGRLLVILGALSAFAPISTDLYLPALPDAADDLGTSASGIQRRKRDTEPYAALSARTRISPTSWLPARPARH